MEHYSYYWILYVNKCLYIVVVIGVVDLGKSPVRAQRDRL